MKPQLDNNSLIIKVENLCVKYGSYEAVKGVSFEVKKGEILGIVGESGSGKSTIARALIGLQPISKGKVTLDASSMQMIFQDAAGSLNPRMTVEQTLSEVIKVKRIKRQSVENLLSQVGLSPAVAAQYPSEMSGGQCQRVSIARALASRPELLIADEPVSALDVSVQARILNLLRDLRNSLNIAIILIAHDLAVVKNVCDYICVMEKGRFVDVGAAETIFENAKSDYTRRLLDAVPTIE